MLPAFTDARSGSNNFVARPIPISAFSNVSSKSSHVSLSIDERPRTLANADANNPRVFAVRSCKSAGRTSSATEDATGADVSPSTIAVGSDATGVDVSPSTFELAIVDGADVGDEVASVVSEDGADDDAAGVGVSSSTRGAWEDATGVGVSSSTFELAIVDDAGADDEAASLERRRK